MSFGSKSSSSDAAQAAATEFSPVDPTMQLQMFESLNKATNTDQMDSMQAKIDAWRKGLRPQGLLDFQQGAQGMANDFRAGLLKMFLGG
jgi:hypothetical protein